MKTFKIKGSLREKTGKKSARDLRSSDLVPCVMYGMGENIHFYIERNIFTHLVYTSDAYLIKIDINGEQYDAILQEVQYHPVTDMVQHADFVQVLEDKKVTMKIPVRLTGTSVGLKSGGKLRQRRRYMKVRGLVKDLPDFCDIDITDVDIGDFIKVGELSFENLEILDPPRAMIVGVVSSRLVAKGLREPVAEEVEEEVVEEEVEEEVPETEEEKEEESKE